MSRHFLFIAVLLLSKISWAQKPSLTISDLGKWPSVNAPKISNDGCYVIYNIKRGENESLIIKSVPTSWEKQIPGASSRNSVITENSQFVITKVKDSLLIIKLSSDDCTLAS